MSNSVFKLNFQGQISLPPARLDQNLAEDSTVRLVNQIVDKLDFTDIEKTYAGGDFIVSSANDAKSAVLCLHEQHLFVPEKSGNNCWKTFITCGFRGIKHPISGPSTTFVRCI